MSQLEPDELARLLTQAVEPIRPDPDGYQRIRAGVERRRRMRLPLYTLVGVVAAAVFAFAALALQPGQPAHVVEPAGPISGSVGGSGSDDLLTPTAGASRGRGSGGGEVDGGPSGTQSAAAPRLTPPSPGTPPSGAVSPKPTASPTRPGESMTMPTPNRKPARIGDIDGDGTTDQVEVSGSELTARLSRGGVVTVQLPAPVASLHHTIIDINGDGFGEILVRTGSENGLDRYLLLRLIAPDTISIVSGGDNGLTAGVDTAGGSAVGFRCTPGAIESYAAASVGSGQYTVLTQTWRLEGTKLVSQPGATPVSVTDTSLFRAACGTL